MTHWMVKVGNGIREVTNTIKTQCEKNRRDFIESLVGTVISTAITFWFLFWLILPFPEIVKSGLEGAKPTLLHVFAALGLFAAFRHYFYEIKTGIHLLDSIPIKYIKFIRASRKKNRIFQ